MLAKIKDIVTDVLPVTLAFITGVFVLVVLGGAF